MIAHLYEYEHNVIILTFSQPSICISRIVFFVCFCFVQVRQINSQIYGSFIQIIVESRGANSTTSISSQIYFCLDTCMIIGYPRNCFKCTCVLEIAIGTSMVLRVHGIFLEWTWTIHLEAFFVVVRWQEKSLQVWNLTDELQHLLYSKGGHRESLPIPNKSAESSWWKERLSGFSVDICSLWKQPKLLSQTD